MVEWTGVGSGPRSARGLRDPAQPFPAVYTIDASMNFQEALKTLTNETGWTMPKAGADGVFRFHLEDGLDFALHSPDGRLCILTSDMGEAPSENEPDYAEKSDRLGTVCAALMPYGRVRLCADSGRLQLVRDFSLDGLSGDGAVREAEVFLNEAARWKKTLEGASGAAPRPTDSPFSQFGSDWFAPGLKF